ncbi:MAG: hypothetical protein IPI85_08085 [Dehalococcoidia bacterium]|uniref:hypothetical protein n=1 Tax=Candidatus Amarobacter glycogenicus TaxID=3140699 RepID=UPI002A17AA55|nr:hypothetical protein [Dehalococcoidia bacterium]MBK6560589.1 hypothetical protein [Dehalococcoidia bacterium]MBK7124970.1 hypothetical protein [Dehalococcoidia bacterium]MBK7329025.1 hypothetical protein [Dehalococcoidia bacterium]MBK8559767.1 hypothetical protein [Dehalococcoidia bacterium]
MTGIFYDPKSRRLHAVVTCPESGWLLVTHNLDAGLYHCRRIMREWLSPEDLFLVEWTIDRERLSA